jgi:DNA-nicking Smr family endonuclease
MSAGGRRLRDEERELWDGVTRAIKPLQPHAQVKSQSPSAVHAARDSIAKSHPKLRPKSHAKPAAAAAAPSKTEKPAKPQSPRLPALAPLGRREKQRLARGTESIDGRLDLHGRTQAQAHAALLSFLRAAQSRGAKNVLVITGKGARAADGERGVLKRQVPLWLKLPELRSLVVGFEQAHIGHGGEGALYVRLRKEK